MSQKYIFVTGGVGWARESRTSLGRLEVPKFDPISV